MPVRGVRDDAGAEEEPPSVDKSGPVSRIKVTAALGMHLKPRKHSVVPILISNLCNLFTATKY